MKTSRLILRSLQYHWRNHLGVLLGVAVATAVITGAMLVGDSVRYTLKRIALDRLGQTQAAMSTGDRFFTTALADNLHAAPALDLAGIATASGGKRRANGVHVLGVEDAFWKTGGAAPLIDAASTDQVALDPRLAEHLGVKIGDTVVLRVIKPSALPRDVPLGSESKDAVVLTMKVKAIASDERFGRFSLLANQVPPYNAFVPLKALQAAAKIGDHANIALVSGVKDPVTNSDGRQQSLTSYLSGKLGSSWTLADADVEIRKLDKLGVIELRSGRVFLDAPVITAATGTDEQPVLTYFVNQLAAGNKATPYSMVTGRPDVKDGEIVVTQWLADDLGVTSGGEVRLTYWVIGPGRKLIEQTDRFHVTSVVPTETSGGDRELMPQFPGLADAESARDWEPGIPIDLDKIRDKDEAYWKEHKGAPKAFVNLDWARKHWGNRFGDLTALRWDAKTIDAAKLAADIRGHLDPASMGLVFQPVREQALTASQTGTDFGGLFIGLSLFLIVAAVVLTGLLFVFGVEQRSSEVGTLLAVGFTPGRVRKLLMGEGLALAVIGGAIGVWLGVAYTKGVLWALVTMWRDAVGTSQLSYHAEPMTLIIGGVSGVIVGGLAMLWVLRKQARQPARALLAARFGIEQASTQAKRGWVSLTVAILCLVGAGAIVAGTGESRGEEAAMGFFGAGALLLIGSLLLCRRLLTGAGAGNSSRLSMTKLGWRNSGRRRGRSLATITMLACGAFLVVAINAFRQAPDETLMSRDSGTGGFALFGQTTLPVYHDLNTPEGRKEYGLDGAELPGVIQMRLREGDEASCLNLNAPQAPPLLGVDPRKLTGRFTFAKTIGEATDPWQLLSMEQADGSIPGVLDDAVAQWILHKGVGDTIDYTDERGRAIKVKIVGTTAPSILQGYILVDEQRFTQAFASLGGYRVFLVDGAAGTDAGKLATLLEDRLQDFGMSTMSAAERLAMFQAVENTYLSIFAALGGLGLVLGVVGLGLVVLRNVLERRSELALMRSVGFTKPSLLWLVLSEHWALLMLGLGCGIVSAAVAIVPAVRGPGAGAPVGLIAVLLGAVVVSGVVWTALATAAALRGKLVEGLRSE